eukprot:scaffold34536_cov21-Tisochrysis_lutea.AAC.2
MHTCTYTHVRTRARTHSQGPEIGREYLMGICNSSVRLAEAGLLHPLLSCFQAPGIDTWKVPRFLFKSSVVEKYLPAFAAYHGEDGVATGWNKNNIVGDVHFSALRNSRSRKATAFNTAQAFPACPLELGVALWALAVVGPQCEACVGGFTFAFIYMLAGYSGALAALLLQQAALFSGSPIVNAADASVRRKALEN